MKTKIFFLSLCTVVLSLTSCKKYQEGPSISLRSKAERVSNTWKMEKVTMNGTDITSMYTSINYLETYDKEGVYSYTSTADSGSGQWTFEANNEQIRRKGVSGQPTLDLTILKLKEKSFWYTVVDGGDTYEFHLIPNE